MLALMLAAMGLLTASLAFDDDSNPQTAPSDEPPEDEENPDNGQDREFGTSAMWDELDGGMGTPDDDVIGVEYNFDDAMADGGAGNDTLHVNSGIAKGGEGDDTISMLYALATDIFGEEFYPVADGGPGNDRIETNRADNGIIDGGEGDDTVRLENDGFHVTLGEGEDTVELLGPDTSKPVGEVFDFNPSEDRIEILRSETDGAVSGFDVTIEPQDGEEASLLTVSLQQEDPDADPQVYEMLVHGLDPSQADEIQVDIVEDYEDPEDTGTIVEPVRDGNDLVIDIDAADARLETIILRDEEDNPLRDIDRVVLNIGEDVEEQFFTYEYTLYDGSESRADGAYSTYIAIVQGPAGLDGGAMSSYVIDGDDSDYLSADGPPETDLGSVHPIFLSPYALVGRVFLGSDISESTPSGIEERSDLNDVDLVVNRA